MSLPIVQVDAFTGKAYAGNPAAICLLPKPAEEGWMQAVAAEMNLSETAFLVERAEGFDLRWFTPAVEVELCGHATLASAHTLWEEGRLRPDEEAHFFTQSGLLTAMRRDGWIEMDFPTQLEHRVEAPPELLQALGVSPA
jgi:PhzF family phenazine biosynthesis protein